MRLNLDIFFSASRLESMRVAIPSFLTLAGFSQASCRGGGVCRIGYTQKLQNNPYNHIDTNIPGCIENRPVDDGMSNGSSRLSTKIFSVQCLVKFWLFAIKISVFSIWEIAMGTCSYWRGRFNAQSVSLSPRRLFYARIFSPPLPA